MQKIFNEQGFYKDIHWSDTEVGEFWSAKDPNIQKFFSIYNYFTILDYVPLANLVINIEKTPYDYKKIASVKNFGGRAEHVAISEILELEENFSVSERIENFKMIISNWDKQNKKQRFYCFDKFIQSVIDGSVRAPLIFMLNGVDYIIGGRTRLMTALCFKCNIMVYYLKDVTVENYINNL